MVGKKADFIIRRVEKGPLQRFKNQNLLLKKFGEVGLKVYRAITGRRTTEELKKDLALEDKIFYPVIDYMQETGMVELVPKSTREIEKAPVERAAEEIPSPPKPPSKKAKEKRAARAPRPPTPKEVKKEVPEEEKPEEEEQLEEIKPIVSEEEEEEEEKEEIEPILPEEGAEIKKEEEKAEEEAPEEEKPEEEKEEEKEEKEEFGFEMEEAATEEEALTSVEKIIKEKYGDVGLQVYALIDGERTAEEIMKEVGITESKLIEILDFMDKQGIIKLEYPKEKKPVAPIAPPTEEVAETGFAPMLEAEKAPEEVKEITIPNPVEVPVIISGDIIKSVQVSAKVFLTFKDEGKRIQGEIDGKKDVIDIALKVNAPLYKVYDILNFLMDNGMLILKPMPREDVKKKYGDDGFTIYKKYGREGLMLYELVGRDLTFKQMADMVTKDKEKAVDMFLFIHEVLGIELPLDRDILLKQLTTQ
ncbi:MAG: hypothetical protein QXT45_02535 [Candidatus Bilamarchaeaceae archaeon]